MSIPTVENPIDLFKVWFDEAKQSGLREPTAMCLSTCSADAGPTSRMVLLKSVDDRGFVFYTNLGSRKAKELDADPRVALNFYWTPPGKQVRIEGRAERVSDQEADEYFASRDRQSQIGAYASKQSQPLTGYFELERRAAEWALRFGVGKVPRPAFWSGYRIVPHLIEFWLEKRFRLHERLVYTRSANGWNTTWLFP